MNARIRASSNKIEHITHLLNQSTTKAAFSFQKSQRFQLNKSFSPNKFYDSTSSLGKRSCSFGIGHRRSLEKLDYTEPARYRIASAFDAKKSDHNQNKFTSFGISRESFYKGKEQKMPLGPGTYNLRDPIGSKPFYMGHRLQAPKRDKNPLSSCSYTIKKEAYSKLSNYKNQGNIKMKTEYFPKDTLHPYKTEVPGPGSYSQRSTFSHGSGSYSQRRKANSSFGVGERMKSAKPDKIGPGNYKRFSQFGNNL